MPASKKRPISDRKLAANRANAARSTGPRTPEGKARSSLNARRHGFAAQDFSVVQPEDLGAVARLQASLVALYRPVNPGELLALWRVALAQNALLRAARLEAGLFADTRQDSLALAEGFLRLASSGNTWSLFLRYQAQAERDYRRALAEFERLKALRSELQNEATTDTQPEENQVLIDPETNLAEPREAGASACRPVPPQCSRLHSRPGPPRANPPEPGPAAPPQARASPPPDATGNRITSRNSPFPEAQAPPEGRQKAAGD